MLIMKKSNNSILIMKKTKPHFFVLLFFIALSVIYFSPVIEGKKLDAHDTKTWQGMSKEVVDFRKEKGDEALWTNSMFSGMPAYQISTKYKANLIQYVDKILMLNLPRPANILFLYLLGFYILLVSLKIDYRLSAVGAIAFAFSSYFFIIIQAGHMTKAHAIAYMPMVVAAVLYTYSGKIYLGGIFTALTVALQVYCNHLQITYYLALILLLIGVFKFISFYNNKDLLSFFKRSTVLLLAAVLASATSYTRLSTTMEYGEDSTRGKSELTNDLDNKTSGLDKDYATQWSYGVFETMTLIIPNFHGGASQGSLGTDSETYNALKRNPNAKNIIKNLPLYWGEQPIVSGPTYVGAIVFFLFILGIFLVKSSMKYWLLIATLMSILLAWGKNFMPLTEFFLEYFPGYNKFRAVSMILVIAEFTIPFLGFLALNYFLFSKSSLEEKKKSLNLSLYISAGITILFALFPSLFFDFEGPRDALLKQNGWPIDALQSDRSNLLSSDAWRSFILIMLIFSLLYLFLKDKIKLSYVILISGFLILIDMWSVNKRYLNDSHFVRKSKAEKPYQKTDADRKILTDKDINYRVFNQSVDPFNDASTSYFHKSIGGYHGAKLKRYQELIENHLSKGNMSVFNMLNTKYFISNKGQVSLNPNALGNAWFVEKINIVDNADLEIAALKNIDTKNTAILDKRYQNLITDSLYFNQNTSINLEEYQPNYLKYNSVSEKKGLIIFSEIFYDKGWNAYINNELQPHFRANYVLRGIEVPPGNNVIEFKFEPSVYNIGEKISFFSSITLLILLSFFSIKELRKLNE